MKTEKVGKNSFETGENLKGHHLMVEEFQGGRWGKFESIKKGIKVDKKGTGIVLSRER